MSQNGNDIILGRITCVSVPKHTERHGRVRRDLGPMGQKCPSSIAPKDAPQKEVSNGTSADPLQEVEHGGYILPITVQGPTGASTEEATALRPNPTRTSHKSQRIFTPSEAQIWKRAHSRQSQIYFPRAGQLPYPTRKHASACVHFGPEIQVWRSAPSLQSQTYFRWAAT